MMGGLDDFLQPLVQLEERLVARARWGLLCDALPVLVETTVVPHADAPEKSTMKYRAALLPRAYKAYVPMTEDSWRTFLSADVFENGIATLKGSSCLRRLCLSGRNGLPLLPASHAAGRRRAVSAAAGGRCA